jgi:hypothetical protein
MKLTLVLNFLLSTAKETMTILFDLKSQQAFINKIINMRAVL